MKKRILVLFLALLISLATLSAYAKEDTTQTLLGIKFGVTKEQWLKAANKKLKSKMKFEDASDAYVSCCRTIAGNQNPDLLGGNVYEITASFTDDQYTNAEVRYTGTMAPKTDAKRAYDMYRDIIEYLVKNYGEPLRAYFTISEYTATDETKPFYALLLSKKTLDEAQFTQLFTQLPEKQVVRMHAQWSNVEFTGCFSLCEGDKQLMLDANLKYYDKSIALPDIKIVQYR